MPTYFLPIDMRWGGDTLKDMTGLITFEEIKQRYESGEDPFALTLEKWIRIKEFLNKQTNYSGVVQLFEAATMKVPFCLDYAPNCNLCPLERICQGPSTYQQILKLLYYFLATGMPLEKEPLIKLVDKLIEEIKEAQMEWKRRLD